jgi:hypothetical protein
MTASHSKTVSVVWTTYEIDPYHIYVLLTHSVSRRLKLLAKHTIHMCELLVHKLIIREKKTNKRWEFQLGRNAYFSVCHNIRSIGPSWDFDFMCS